MFCRLARVCDKTPQEGSTVKQQCLTLFRRPAGSSACAPVRTLPAILGSASLIISGNSHGVCLAMLVCEWSAIISHIDLVSPCWGEWNEPALGLSWSGQPALLHITLKVHQALKQADPPGQALSSQLASCLLLSNPMKWATWQRPETRAEAEGHLPLVSSLLPQRSVACLDYHERKSYSLTSHTSQACSLKNWPSYFFINNS